MRSPGAWRRRRQPLSSDSHPRATTRGSGRDQPDRRAQRGADAWHGDHHAAAGARTPTVTVEAPRRRRRGVLWLLGGVAALLLVEVALVVAVLTSPSTSSSLRDRVAAVERVVSGDSGRAGVPERVGTRVRRAVSGWLAGLRGDAASAKDATVSRAFSKCASCHPNYARTRRFSATYMNHPLHAELGVACATCHVDTVHPSPDLPDERVCSTCHTDVRTTGSCQRCHPPGSLPHFYLLGYPRDDAVDCGTCHPTGSFRSTAASPKVPPHAMNGSDRTLCLSCHQPATCDNCHANRHPPDWVQAHGGVAVDGTTTCEQCHTTRWCADRCHAAIPTRPPIPALPPSTPEGDTS